MTSIRRKVSFLIAASAVLSGLGVLAQIRPAPAETKRNVGFQAAADYSRSTRGLAVLILKNDKVVFEEYQNGHSAETAWMLASGTKSFAGVLLAAAIEDKLISGFDERVAETISEWRSDDLRSKITLRELLSLTSGIGGGTIGIPPSYSDSVNSPAKFAPGDRFQYGPVPFQIFGELLRRKLAPKKETVHEYLKRRILDPLDIKVARWTMQEGQPNLPSGAFLTAREWAKFGTFLKNRGRAGGRQVVNSELLDQLYIGSMANPNYGLTFWLNLSHDRNARAGAGRLDRIRQVIGGGETAMNRVSREGIGRELPADLVMAAGLGNQRLYVVPSLDLVVVRQGRLSDFDDQKFLIPIIEALRTKPER